MAGEFNAGAVVGTATFDDSQWVAGVNRVIDSTDKMEKETKESLTKAQKWVGDFKDKFVASFTGMFTAQAAYDLVKKGLKAVVDTVKLAIAECAAQEKAEKKLATALGFTSKALINQSGSLQEMLGVQDDAILTGHAFLAQLGLTEEQILAVTPAVIDFSQATGQDLAESFIMVGQSTGEGRNLLIKYGIDLKDVTGRSEKLSAITEGLTARFGGQAAAIRDTLSGAFQAANASSGELLETFGALIQSPLKNLVNNSVIATNAITEMVKGFGAFTGMLKDPEVEGLNKEQMTLNSLVRTITSANTSHSDRLILIKKLKEEYPGYLGNLDAEKVTNGELITKLEEANKAYMVKAILIEQDKAISILQKNASKELNKEIQLSTKINKQVTDLMIKLNAEKETAGKSDQEAIQIMIKLNNQKLIEATRIQDSTQANTKAYFTADKVRMGYRDIQLQLQNLNAQYLKNGIGNYKEQTDKLTESEKKLTEQQQQDIIVNAALEKKLGSIDKLLKTIETKKTTDKKVTQDQTEATDKQSDSLMYLNNNMETYEETAARVNKTTMDAIVPITGVTQAYEDQSYEILSTLGKVSGAVGQAYGEMGGYGFDFVDNFSGGMSEITSALSDTFTNIASKVGDTMGTVTAAITGTLQAVSGVVDMVFSMVESNYENELAVMQQADADKLSEMETDKENRMASLDDEYQQKYDKLIADKDTGIITEAEYNIQKGLVDAERATNVENTEKALNAKIDSEKKKQRDKENAQKKKMFEANKANQIANIWIQTAIGVVSAFAGACQWPGVSMIAGLIFAGVMSGILIASAAAQTVVVGQQQFVPEKALGGMASGVTRVNDGGGGEIITLPDGSQVIPNDISEQIALSVGKRNTQNNNISVSFAGAQISDGLSLKKVTDYVVNSMTDKLIRQS
jgi:hypothetical protein